ncbi:MAG: hypothetical protein P8L44_24630 [Opitutales bacterium]|jgi:hypothetical protein|nr:hypothetical protein [Opitutales bacterium]
MKKLLIIPALLLIFSPVFADTVLEEQAIACISENGSNTSGLESCLSKLFVPASMDCDELLQVHRTIVKAAEGRNNATIRAVSRVSSKLAIVSLSANCYSPDVAARLVARAGSEASGGSSIVADGIVSGAVDAAGSLGVDSGSLANSTASASGDGDSSSGSQGGPNKAAASAVEIYYDNEVNVSPSGTNS